MSKTSSTTVSIVKTLEAIIQKSVATTQPMTTSSTLLYKAGSDLTAVQLGQLSY